MSIRNATINDLKQIISIYNEYINTTITMDGEPTTAEKKKEWFLKHNSDHPIICYSHESTIDGWASLSKWSEKSGYAKSVELSVYVSKNNLGKGIGKSLIKELLIIAKANDYHSIVSRIDRDNIISLNLHRKFGFSEIGIMKEIGFKFGRYIDIVILQLLL